MVVGLLFSLEGERSPVGKETKRGVSGWYRRLKGEGHTISGLGSPAYIDLQKQLVSQGGLVENIKCDYEGALREEERKNEGTEGYGALRKEVGQDKGEG